MPVVPWNRPRSGLITRCRPPTVLIVAENWAALAVGVNGGEASDGSESPMMLWAVTVQVYSTPFVRPVTCAGGRAVVVAVCVSSGFPVAVHVTV